MFARFGPALILCLVIATLGVPSALRAQSTDDLMNRIGRLEAELADLQRFLFTEKSKTGAQSGAQSGPQTGTAPVVRSTPVQRGLSGSDGTALAVDDPANAARVEIRLQQLESQMRNLTGQAEEATFNLGQLSDRLNQMVADIDQRLATLGGTAPKSATTPSTSTAAGTTSAGAGAGAVKGGKKPGVFGHLTESDLAKINVKTVGAQSGATSPAPEKPANAEAGTGTAEAATPAPDNDLLPDGSPQDRYDHAFSYVRRHDYETAEQMLKAFLAAHKDDALAGNAMYWLGETYYVRGNFADAAITFAEGYERYPGSKKAADNLLKLSVSLAKLKRPEDACLALSQLREQFPDASANIRQRAEDEGKRLACTG